MTGPASPTASRSGELFPWVVLAVACPLAAVWGAGCVALALAGEPQLVGFPDAGVALVRLPGRLGDPASAWPAQIGRHLPGPVTYWFAQLVVLVAAVAIAVGCVRVWRSVMPDRPRPMGLQAEAGFARRRDLRRLRVPAPVEGRLTLGRAAGALVAAEADASLAVIGPTGCGKTAGFAIPALLEWRGPVLATSVKADLLHATERHRRGRGEVWVYDPTSSATPAPDAWSPLAASTTWRDAQRVAAWMVEAAQPRQDTVNDSDYWYSQARKGLAPYLLAAARAGGGIDDLAHWVDTQEQDAVTEALRSAANPEGESWDDLWERTIAMTRDLLAGAGGEAADLAEQPLDEWPGWLRERVRAAAETEWRIELETTGDGTPEGRAPLASARALWRKEPRLRGSVFATMENVLSSWADPGVAWSGRTNDIDLDRWLAGDNTIYVVAPAHEQARLRPVLTVLVQQVIRRAYDTAAASGGRLRKPCLVLLDEAGNIAPLRDLPGYASTARSHGITFVTVWQDVAQIRALYRDRADTVLNNHRAKLFGAGIADTGTLEYASRLVGDEPRTERNVSVDVTGGRRSVSEHRSYRRAAPVDVLRRINAGEGLLLYGRELPAHVRLRTWFDDPRLRRLGPGEEVSGAGVHR